MKRKHVPRYFTPGQVFGLLTVIGEGPKFGAVRGVECSCACGSPPRAYRAPNLYQGKAKSCGCVGKKKIAEVGRRNFMGPGVAARNSVINAYRKSAQYRGLDLTLTVEEMTVLFSLPCHYCGAPPHGRQVNRRSSSEFVYSGLDRVDSALGYVRGNVVPCCAMCNRMKNDFGVDAFLIQVCRIYQHVHAGGVPLPDGFGPEQLALNTATCGEVS